MDAGVEGKLAPGFYQIRLCENPKCMLRYPVVEEQPVGQACPRCGADTQVVHTKKLVSEAAVQGEIPTHRRIYALLDNLRSAWNVGSIIRTAEGAGFAHLYLGGITPTPQSRKVLKTSLGAERSLSWSQHNNSLRQVERLKSQGYLIWALENVPGSVPIFETVKKLYDAPRVLVVGNEVCGIDPDILRQSDRLLAIPMQGLKKSLNVAVAFGIAAALLANPCHELVSGD
jgi:23S rRNA (guanosine2251-2'-O)-methyltransferase